MNAMSRSLRVAFFLSAAGSLLLQPSCSLINETIWLRTHEYRCTATLRNAAGRTETISSDMAWVAGGRRFATINVIGTTGRDLVLRDWRRAILRLLTDPARSAEATMRFGSDTWCLDSLDATVVRSGACASGSGACPVEGSGPLADMCTTMPPAPGAPRLALSTDVLDLGPIPLGASSPSQTVRASNAGGGTLRLTAIGFRSLPSTEFVIDDTDCRGGRFPGEVAGGESLLGASTRSSCDVVFHFVPVAAGSRGAVVRFDAFDALDTARMSNLGALLSLSGTGVAGHLAVMPDSLCFNAPPGPDGCVHRTLTIRNTGTAGNVNVSSVDLAVACAGWRRDGTSRPLPAVLGPGEAMTVDLANCGTPARCFLNVNSDAQEGPLEVPLYGSASGCM